MKACTIGIVGTLVIMISTIIYIYIVITMACGLWLAWVLTPQ
jgi:hypothetical protein